MKTPNDETKELRRDRLLMINCAVESHDPAAERQRLEAQHGKVWSSAELFAAFEVIGFAPPYVVVRRKADGSMGSLEFQNRPRFYFNPILD